PWVVKIMGSFARVSMSRASRNVSEVSTPSSSGTGPPGFEVEKNTGLILAKSFSSSIRCISTDPTMPRQPIIPTDGRAATSAYIGFSETCLVIVSYSTFCDRANFFLALYAHRPRPINSWVSTSIKTTPAMVLPVSTKYRPMPAHTNAKRGPATKPRNVRTSWRCEAGAVLGVVAKAALPSLKPVLDGGARGMPPRAGVLSRGRPRIIQLRCIRVAVDMQIEYTAFDDRGYIYGLII